MVHFLGGTKKNTFRPEFAQVSGNTDLSSSRLQLLQVSRHFFAMTLRTHF